MGLGEGDVRDSNRYTTTVGGTLTWVTSAHGSASGAIHFSTDDQTWVTTFTQDPNTCPFIPMECSEGVSVAVWFKLVEYTGTTNAKDFITIGKSIILRHSQGNGVFRLQVKTDTHKWQYQVPEDYGIWHHLTLSWTEAEHLCLVDGVLIDLDLISISGPSVTAEVVLNILGPNFAPFVLDELYVWTKAKPLAFMKSVSGVHSHEVFMTN